MPYRQSMDLQPKQAQSLKQMQRLMMSPHMQQALNLLQLPILELSQLIETELEQNPVLETQRDEEADDADMQALETENAEASEEADAAPEKELAFDDHDFEVLRQLDEEFRDYLKESGPAYKTRTAEDDKFQTYLESSIQAETTLFSHLMQQAQETFSEADELKMAEAIIGNLDRNGYLTVSLQEIAQLGGFTEAKLLPVLRGIQSFEPCGVGAANIQEALLLQLRRRGQPKTLAYNIIDQHYEDLLHNRIPNIQKGLGCTLQDIAKAIKEDIARLDLHPGLWYSHTPVQTIIPDVALKQEGEALHVVINEEPLPLFRFNHRYLNMLEDPALPQETKDFIRQKLMSAKWLMRNISQRQSTLERIADFLAKKQSAFFLNPEGTLIPMTLKIVSEELELHESTVARAVANKYIDTPRGIFPLRFFFTNAYTSSTGEDISSRTVRDVLLEMIHNEDKRKPLSDEALALQIQARGITCARRTVAKYRALLNIGNAHQRKLY